MKRPYINLMFAGSVDDGKSTLLGRIMIDSDRVKKDVLADIRKNCQENHRELDYSLVTDGLASERAQGITVDIAHLYTDIQGTRVHILDCPGHTEYTRNMAVAASQADAAIVLVDATKGFTEQTTRHLDILRLMNVNRVIIALNKVDLLNYDEVMINSMIGTIPYPCVPISALKGWNVMTRAKWQKTCLIDAIEACMQDINQEEEKETSLVFNVFSVIKDDNGRKYTGRCIAGTFTKGTDCTVVRTGQMVRIGDIVSAEGERAVIRTENECDLDRGDILVATHGDTSFPKTNVDSTVLWFANTPLVSGDQFIVQGCEYTTHHAEIHTRHNKRIMKNEWGDVRCDFDTPVPIVKGVPTRYLLIDTESLATVGCLIVHEGTGTDS